MLIGVVSLMRLSNFNSFGWAAFFDVLFDGIRVWLSEEDIHMIYCLVVCVGCRSHLACGLFFWVCC